VARQRPGIREDHPPAAVGRPAPEFAVDEIGEAPEQKAERRDDGGIVEDAERRTAARPGQEHNGYDDPGEAAVERHPALPQAEDRGRIGEILARIVEDHIGEAPAQNHPERAPGDEIVEVAPVHRRPRPPQHPPEQPPAAENADDIGEAVPADDERAEAEGDRVEPERLPRDGRLENRHHRRHNRCRRIRREDSR
jgi:hypothetical protein